MSSEIELQPLVKNAGRKTTLLLAGLAAVIVLALAIGLGVYQSTRDAEALKRFPDRVEVLSAGWVAGAPGMLQMKLRLTRKDGQAFDPRSGVTLTDPTPGGGLLHYVRGWTDPRARRPAREVLMDFRQTVRLPAATKEPVHIEITGWTQPRIHLPWLVRLKALFGKPPTLRLTVPLYPLEGGAAILPPPVHSTGKHPLGGT